MVLFKQLLKYSRTKKKATSKTHLKCLTMNQLKFCLTIVLIIGRSVKADQRSALYQVLPATDSEDEENTIDWILQQPWDQQSVNMSLTKQRISVKFQSMVRIKSFMISLDSWFVFAIRKSCHVHCSGLK